MELWDLYDENGNKTGETFEREMYGKKEFPKGRYHIVCDILVRHDDGTFLLMKRDEGKDVYPGFWEASAGGAAQAGETPLMCAKRELLEETGIKTDRLTLIATAKSPKHPVVFYSFIAYTDCDKTGITLQEGETTDFKWVDREGVFEYMASDTAIKTHNNRNRIYFDKMLRVDALADRPAPEWLKDVPENDFISPYPPYETGKYYDRFHKDTFTDEDGNTMSYYYFDPREYGYRKGPKYPLLISFHGAGNSLVGDTVINYTGAEFYAKDDYQAALGGAFILVPVANETSGKDGVKGTWDKSYDKIVWALIQDFIKTKTDDVSLRVFFGNSAGARYVFHMMEEHPYEVNIAIPIGSSEIPEKKYLHDFDLYGNTLFFAMGKRDEFNNYETKVVPRLKELESMRHCFIYTPDWVRNSDKGIASIYAGVEMGQHCLVNPMHQNLMFDDGTPMDERLPKGVTGWLAEAFSRIDRALISSGYCKIGYDAYGGKYLHTDYLMQHWGDDKLRTGKRPYGFHMDDAIEFVDTGFFENLPSLATLWILNPVCRLNLTEKEIEIFKKNNTILRGEFDSSAEDLAKEHGLRFLHTDTFLAKAGEYFGPGVDIMTICFGEDGSAWIHQDCRCQGISAGNDGGGEKDVPLPKDFYLTMTPEDIANLCWGSCHSQLVENGKLEGIIAACKERGGFLLDYSKM